MRATHIHACCTDTDRCLVHAGRGYYGGGGVFGCCWVDCFVAGLACGCVVSAAGARGRACCRSRARTHTCKVSPAHRYLLVPARALICWDCSLYLPQAGEEGWAKAGCGRQAFGLLGALLKNCGFCQPWLPVIVPSSVHSLRAVPICPQSLCAHAAVGSSTRHGVCGVNLKGHLLHQCNSMGCYIMGFSVVRS